MPPPKSDVKQKNPTDGGSIPPALIYFKMDGEKRSFVAAVSVLVGTCIGAGVLGIPYVAARSGFWIALAYIILLGGIILLLNLYLGEASLRTKGNHQLTGYAEKYIGKKAKRIMNWAAIFGIYSAIVAYIVGVGESLSFLIYGNIAHSFWLGIIFGLVMSGLIWTGIKSLKRYEKIGVGIILILIIVIIAIFSGRVELSNLNYVNFGNLLLPFGVVLFALTSFFAIPQVEIILNKNEKMMKKVIIISSIISVTFYALFTLVVVGFRGVNTPEVATLALGAIFVFLGMFTMFTSHLSLGDALDESFIYDNKYKKVKAWFLASVVPILIYVLISFSNFFSFTKILSIGGVVSGGAIAILALFIVKNAKKKGNRKPEYKVPINWFIIIVLSLIFVIGVVREIVVAIKGF